MDVFVSNSNGVNSNNKAPRGQMGARNVSNSNGVNSNSKIDSIIEILKEFQTPTE